MKTRISVNVLGESFEIEIEEEFLEFTKEDLLKLNTITPKNLLFLILKKNKELFECQNDIKKIISKLENI